MRAKLVVVGGDTKTKEVDLRLPAILGRGREATLTLPHPLVSRQHCEITEVEGRLIVRDLGSLNGTFVANERIDEAVLENGQLLTVGTVTFRAVYLDGSTVGMGVEAGLEVESGLGPPPGAALPETIQMEETVPAPEPTPETSPTPAPTAETEPGTDAPNPPMAKPITADDAGDDDDDLSAFFDSLK